MSFFYPFEILRRYFHVRAEEQHAADIASSKGKVVVGGGTGFVGTELCRLLKRNHYDVVVISRFEQHFLVMT